MGSMAIETNSFETIHLKRFIWDRIHLRPHSFENCSLETTFIWDFFILDTIHSRRHSFESYWFETYAFDTYSFETTFTWDFFIWDHTHLRSNSFYATLNWSSFSLLCIRFLWYTFHFFAGELKFWKVSIHLKFCNVTLFYVQGWLTLGCKCTRTLKHRGGQKTLHTSGMEGSVAPLKCHLGQFKELYALRSCTCPFSSRHNSFSF